MSIALVKDKNDNKTSKLVTTNPSMYASYLQERLPNKHIIETEKGFVTYFFIDDGVYAEDVYILPEHRLSNEASRFGDQIAQIARDKGLGKMYGSVKPSANQSTESLKFLLAYGFRLFEAGPDAIVLVKDI